MRGEHKVKVIRVRRETHIRQLGRPAKVGDVITLRYPPHWHASGQAVLHSGLIVEPVPDSPPAPKPTAWQRIRTSVRYLLSHLRANA